MQSVTLKIRTPTTTSAIPAAVEKRAAADVQTPALHPMLATTMVGAVVAPWLAHGFASAAETARREADARRQVSEAATRLDARYAFD